MSADTRRRHGVSAPLGRRAAAPAIQPRAVTTDPRARRGEVPATGRVHARRSTGPTPGTQPRRGGVQPPKTTDTPRRTERDRRRPRGSDKVVR
ncbi:MAG: hypothetical protein WCC60_18255, partial [Ilumatobacteraceae bacterium]